MSEPSRQEGSAMPRAITDEPITPTAPGSATAAPPAAPAPASFAAPTRPAIDPSLPPRLRTADRSQLLSPMTIDDLLEADHPARALWRFCEGLDLTALYDRIRARGSSAGRPAIDPRVLVALWLYATLQGVNSANALADLVVRHDAYFWLAGGLPVNAHTLSDFRVRDADFLESLLEHSVNLLRGQGLIDLDRVAQDGVRVRASAGAASFRRRETLEKLLQEALVELQRTQQEGKADPVAGQEVAAAPAEEPSAQQRGAQRRHARQRVERIRQALLRMPEMEAKKEKARRKKKPRKKEAGAEEKDEKKEAARVSTTDAEASVMKMADGGYRPAFNVQFSTACQGQVIVGVEVVREGTDQGQLPPMLEQIEERFEQRPREALVDGGFANHEDIERVQTGEKPCKVYAPVPEPRKEGVDRHQAKASDTEQVAEWRTRMGTDEAKQIYKQRAATAECVNAQARNRGLTRFLVRGLQKVKAVALWFAAAHNLARCFSLLPAPTG